MRALVTMETTVDGRRRLESLGFEVVTAGWGVTRRALEPEQLRAAAQGCDVVLTEIETVDAALLDAAPTIRLVGTARGGPVNVDAAACAARGVTVIYTPARNAESVADATVGLVLAVTRGLTAADRHLRTRGWHVNGDLPYLHFRGPELGRLRVGVVGAGAVGARVVQRLRHGFGCDVRVHDPASRASVPLPELLAGSDLVTLHCPRVPATQGLIDAAAIALMPRGSYVVNTAGGGIVDEEALVAALRSGHLAGAALDCFATEPLPADSPLLDAPGLVLTPHVTGAADDVVRHHTRMLLDDVARWLAGRPLVHAVR